MQVENPMLEEGGSDDDEKFQDSATGQENAEEARASADAGGGGQSDVDEPLPPWERAVSLAVSVYYVAAGGVMGLFVAMGLYGGAFLITHWTEKERQARAEFWRGDPPPTLFAVMGVIIVAMVSLMVAAAKRVPHYGQRYRETAIQVWQAWPTALAIIVVCARMTFWVFLMMFFTYGGNERLDRLQQLYLTVSTMFGWSFAAIWSIVGVFDTHHPLPTGPRGEREKLFLAFHVGLWWVAFFFVWDIALSKVGVVLWAGWACVNLGNCVMAHCFGYRLQPVPWDPTRPWKSFRVSRVDWNADDADDADGAAAASSSAAAAEQQDGDENPQDEQREEIATAENATLGEDDDDDEDEPEQVNASLDSHGSKISRDSFRIGLFIVALLAVAMSVLDSFPVWYYYIFPESSRAHTATFGCILLVYCSLLGHGEPRPVEALKFQKWLCEALVILGGSNAHKLGALKATDFATALLRTAPVGAAVGDTGVAVEAPVKEDVAAENGVRADDDERGLESSAEHGPVKSCSVLVVTAVMWFLITTLLAIRSGMDDMVGDPARVGPVLEITTGPVDAPLYFVASYGITWHDARKACQRDGADLASVHSAAEFREMMELAGMSHAFIGLNDVEENQKWEWTDGSDASFSWNDGKIPWMPGEPGGGGESFAMFGGPGRLAGTLHDVNADYIATGYVCRSPRSSTATRACIGEQCCDLEPGRYGYCASCTGLASTPCVLAGGNVSSIDVPQGCSATLMFDCGETCTGSSVTLGSGLHAVSSTVAMASIECERSRTKQYFVDSHTESHSQIRAERLEDNSVFAFNPAGFFFDKDHRVALHFPNIRLPAATAVSRAQLRFESSRYETEIGATGLDLDYKPVRITKSSDMYRSFYSEDGRYHYFNGTTYTGASDDSSGYEQCIDCHDETWYCEDDPAHHEHVPACPARHIFFQHRYTNLSDTHGEGEEEVNGLQTQTGFRVDESIKRCRCSERLTMIVRAEKSAFSPPLSGDLDDTNDIGSRQLGENSVEWEVPWSHYDLRASVRDMKVSRAVQLDVTILVKDVQGTHNWRADSGLTLVFTPSDETIAESSGRVEGFKVSTHRWWHELFRDLARPLLTFVLPLLILLQLRRGGAIGTLSDGMLEHAPLSPLLERLLLGGLTFLLAVATLNVLRAAAIRVMYGGDVYGRGDCGEVESNEFALVFVKHSAIWGELLFYSFVSLWYCVFCLTCELSAVAITQSITRFSSAAVFSLEEGYDVLRRIDRVSDELNDEFQLVQAGLAAALVVGIYRLSVGLYFETRAGSEWLCLLSTWQSPSENGGDAPMDTASIADAIMALAFMVPGLLGLIFFPARVTAATDHVKDTLQDMQLEPKSGSSDEAYFQRVAEIDLLVTWAKERDMGYKVFEVVKVNYFTLKTLISLTSTAIIAMQTAGSIVGGGG